MSEMLRGIYLQVQFCMNQLAVELEHTKIQRRTVRPWEQDVMKCMRK